MERLPHRVKIERTPEQQAERVARDGAIRRRVKAGPDRLESVSGEGPEVGRAESRREAGPPDWPAKGLVASLRAERRRLGLSLADVAERMGADRSAVHKIEVGLNRNPTFDTLSRYAAALDMGLMAIPMHGPASVSAADDQGDAG